MDTILILDFGGQTTQLISRRIREAGVYTKILAGDSDLNRLDRQQIKGLVLSGSPYSVNDADAPKPDPSIYSLDIPVLGICYGLQRIIKDHGGRISSSEKREYGRARLRFASGLVKKATILEGLPDGMISWMSHGDTIDLVAPGFVVWAHSENGLPAVIAHQEKSIYGLQFHPEVSHTQGGEHLLTNFALRVCAANPEWNVKAVLARKKSEISERIGHHNILLLTSGGVDSTVVAALLLAALPAQQVHLMYIDTGLMRLGESDEVRSLLKKLDAAQLHVIDASSRFFTALRGVTDPEQKRRIIGDLFVTVQEQEIGRLKINSAFLAQGTLYTDLIESGRGVGEKAEVIKSHHNVRSPLIEKKREQGLVLEPLAELYKDEVRELGRLLGVPEATVRRHPFPGPGLGVRILGDITPERCHILRQADAIYIDELKQRGLYDQIWQAFAVLLPLRSVGVSGDTRRFGYVLSLRAVVSRDGMTADVFPFAAADLLEISSRITNEIKEIGRVVYDISSKPPATIEWE